MGLELAERRPAEPIRSCKWGSLRGRASQDSASFNRRPATQAQSSPSAFSSTRSRAQVEPRRVDTEQPARQVMQERRRVGEGQDDRRAAAAAMRARFAEKAALPLEVLAERRGEHCLAQRASRVDLRGVGRSAKYNGTFLYSSALTGIRAGIPSIGRAVSQRCLAMGAK